MIKTHIGNRILSALLALLLGISCLIPALADEGSAPENPPAELLEAVPPEEQSGDETPEDLSREQLAVLLYRYAQYAGLEISPDAGSLEFDDAGSASPWAAEALRWAVREGILQGVSAHRLSPGAAATRAQGAAILLRYHTLETARAA